MRHRHPGVRSLIRRHQVSAYFGLAFGIAWTGTVLAAGPQFLRGQTLRPVEGLLVFTAMLLGPSLSGVALSVYLDGREGLRDLFASRVDRRAGGRWALVPLVFPVLISVVVLLLRALAPGGYALAFAPAGVAVGLLAGFLEEIGWTGYALPRLLGSGSVLSAAVWLGLLHSGWHAAADFLAGSPARGAWWLPHFAAFALSMTAMRVLLVWVYVNRRSLVLAQVMHASSTGSLAVLVPLSLSPASDTVVYAAYGVALWAVVALVVTRFGRSLAQVARSRQAD